MAEQPSRIAVLGGGPAGAFCAIWLCRLARDCGRELEVVVFDHKSFEKLGPAGCNMCAGVIPESLVRNMQDLGMELPEHVIQRRIEGYYLETQGGGVDIPAPENTRLYATFRGPGPLGVYPAAHEGFDWFLLAEAQRAGAAHVSKLVADVAMPAEENGRYRVTCRDGSSMDCDVVVGAFGVNSNLGGVFQRLGFGYRPPRTVRARQAEIPLDPGFLRDAMQNRMLIFAMGWRGIRYAAITPKRRHATVTLIGEDPGRSDMERFLRSSVVRQHLPPGWSPPEQYCSCAPRLPVSAARTPVHDNLVVIGDANTSRYLKNGIESSFYTAMWAAKAIADGRTEASQLRREYLELCRQTYVRDNLFGRGLLRLHDLISRSPVLARSHVHVARREQASRAQAKLLTEVLWDTFTGNVPYRTIVRKVLNPSLHARLAAGLVRTACHLPMVQTATSAPGRSAAAAPRKTETVVIIGGGPAGTACAITLAREGGGGGRTRRIILIEAKRFGEQHNQCAGVLSPPGDRLIEEVLGEGLPGYLVQRRIKGYVLHGRGCAVYLDGDELGETAYALRRAELDRLLLKRARDWGVEVVQSRATDLEFDARGVVVYTEGPSFHGDGLVGAFALDEGMARRLSRGTRYRAPKSLDTLACKIHPAGLDPIPGLLDDCIHVFLPKRPSVDFGALIPKGNHIVAIIAGAQLKARDMALFMESREVADLVPRAAHATGLFKGAFPLGPARGLYGKSYVVIGDAGGMVRPFKGKGINSALEGGRQCARSILKHGVSMAAFAESAGSQRRVASDVWYGRFVRRLVKLTARLDLLDPIVEQAAGDRILSQALFDCISGRTTYRDVVLRAENVSWLPTAVWRCLAHRGPRAGREVEETGHE